MRNNPIQFAVVREDPLVEAAIIEKFKIKKLLLVCSGGCSVLSLKALFPDLNICAFDFNQAQIDLTQAKLNHLKQTKTFNQVFNIEDPTATGLNQCGNFESLFRGFRDFIFDFILDKESMRLIFSEEEIKSSNTLLFEHRYWPVAFSLFFSDPLLQTMFGEAAIQHAPRGSYPRYFQQVFEKGLKTKGAHKNYFLHHVLLGHYINQPECLPYYLTHPNNLNVNLDFIHGPIQAVEDLKSFDLIQLSNIMDWMSEDENKVIADYITKNTSSGAILLIRQLNNEQSVLSYFPDFELDQPLSESLYSIDRSLFYSSILCFKRR